MSYIRRTGGAAIEEIQKRASIAWRKEQSLERKRQRSELELGDMDGAGAGPSKRTKFSPSEPVLIPPPDDDEQGQGQGQGEEQAMDDDDGITPQQEDFNFICEFFASGGGDDGSDAEVWARLTDQVGFRKHLNHACFSMLTFSSYLQKLCQTFPSWPEFYEFHKEAVNTELHRLSALQDVQPAVSENQVAEPSPAPS